MSETNATVASASPELTPIAEAFRHGGLTISSGVTQAARYGAPEAELDALLTGSAVYDLGGQRRFRLAGEDRVRWLNGMVTNSIKDLAAGQLCYTFLLNAQGRIQGDGDVYATDNTLLFATDAAQAAKLAEHLDRFIIMDDVELAAEPEVSALGIAGPTAEALLHGLGFTVPGVEQHAAAAIENDPVLLAQTEPGVFVLWINAGRIPSMWERLLNAGAVPCGLDAVESWRVLRGVPRYGVDIHDRTLAQETGVMRALNFNKGCYLGQEIVERVRSRGAVHRGITVFNLEGPLPGSAVPVFVEGGTEPVGELTSFATVASARTAGQYALGMLRKEFAQQALRYGNEESKGTATALARPVLASI